jgi:hypothetical protein
MLKWNKLLLNDGDLEAFDERIEPSARQRDYLDACRIKIREHLRDGIRKASVSVLGLDHAVAPRFRLQGSCAYRTCIQRAHANQEMDLDYGVYLPVSAFEDHRPRVAAKAYFELVESLLRRLCQTEGWTLDSSKDTCVRLKVSPWAHIDVPLYAAPEHIFTTIVERAAVAKAEYADFDASSDLTESYWVEMDEIHLAQRNGTWKPSDPAAVTRWWRALVEEHGEQLRRICRYVKAWRDFWWPNGGPSSVALMIAIARDFSGRPRRDDLALEDAAAQMALALRGELRERGIDFGKEDFLAGLSAEEKRVAAERADQLAKRLKLVRSYGPNLRADAVADVSQQLGDRIPNRPDWLESDGSADVRAAAATIVAAPVVKATESG